MKSTADRAIAIVGVGAVLPDAPDAASFWKNLCEGRYSVSEVPGDRWDSEKYFDPDPKAVDKTYSKIGGWVRECDWNPLGWRLPIPPKVSDVMDLAQKWAIVSAREALADYGYPDRALDRDRTAVIMGNALGGDSHLMTAMRVLFPEIAEELVGAPSFQALGDDVRHAVMEELRSGIQARIPDITEDTMPGELANIVAGRLAALFDFKGPNYITDAACASAMAAISAGIEGLIVRDFDAVLTGGIDANMNPSTFVKFCKIGALSATGTRPYAEGADGFVMGEGAACFLLKRLGDAERDGDAIYAVIRGMGGSSDGRGKGITAPNPIGQRLAVSRSWEKAGLEPEAGDLVEGHGTSTKVGDVVEVESLTEVFGRYGLPPQSVALGSVKSNIGHLKAAAGAAGLLKATLALKHKLLPPSLNFHAPNPAIDFARSPFRVTTELTSWEKKGANGDSVRRAGVSTFGFGGTNFHAVLEEHVPGRLERARTLVASAELRAESPAGDVTLKPPLRGALVLGGTSEAEIAERLRSIKAEAEKGTAPPPETPLEADLSAPIRLAIDYGDARNLADSAGKALKALDEGQEGRWKALRNKGVYLGRGRPGKVAFLFTGQGSQYVNMLAELRATEPIVADTFVEADRTMEPLIDGSLTERIFVDPGDEERVAQAAEGLRQTAITQPAVLTVDTALARLLGAFGVIPDMVMGHSLGEYGALVTAGALPFAGAITAVAARGKAMTDLSLGDNGLMAAVFGPVDRVEELLHGIDGYVVVANLNSSKECVIGGATEAVEAATAALQAEGLRVAQLPVSHAFHTKIVEQATAPLADVLTDLDVRPPEIPIISNVTGEFYPMGQGVEPQMIELLGRQIGSPVQFVKGLDTLYDAGARVFIELGPKRVLYGLADDVLGGRRGFKAFYTNHPRTGDVVSFNRALCGLYAEGLGRGMPDARAEISVPEPRVVPTPEPTRAPATAAPGSPLRRDEAPRGRPTEASPDRLLTLGRMFAEFLEQSFDVYAGGVKQKARIGITGASLGLPGTERVFEDTNLQRILGGEVLIGSIPEKFRRAMVDRHVTRLVKGASGEANFVSANDTSGVLKLAGIGGKLDLVDEYGFPEDRVQALDRITCLAIAAGIEALRDAGIPLVQRYKTTTTSTRLSAGWALPADMRDDTAVIFGSAFPGMEALAKAMDAYHEDRSRHGRREELQELRASLAGRDDAATVAELDRRIEALTTEIEAKAFQFDRRFLFQVLTMGHAQFAEYIGARGPNVQINAACATSTQAVALAQDWIQAGRCRRVIVLTADDITTDTLLPWMASGFLASGAAAIDERVEDAALPFDRRRHGMIIGMGSTALVVEDMAAVAERGIHPICEVLGTITANSAFHGSRLDVAHIVGVMEELVSGVERRWGVSRQQMASQTVFVSHETYTPARGGSASAEVEALRSVFGDAADSIVIANTKGFTGHAMGVGIEDTLAVKMLESGIVPPVANFRDIDPALGALNLSRGGSYPITYALRVAAGFGSQISMMLLRWTPPPDGARRAPDDMGYQHRIADLVAWREWLARVTGYDAPELEVVERTFRVRDQGPPSREPAPRPVPAARDIEVPRPAPVQAPVQPAPPPPPPPPVRAQEPVIQPVATPVIPAAPSPPEAPRPVPRAPAGTDEVAARVLAIVSEQTGYPPDMLELDLDLEADLGIDTVKQAEMFAAIRGVYDIERDETLALRDYPTLARAIEFVFEKRPDLRSGAPEPAEERTESVEAGPMAGPSAAEDAVRDRVLAIVSEQTGYPPDMLELDLDLEADLGIDTVKQAEMFAAIRGVYDIERDETLALRDYPTLARAIEFVFEKRPDLRGGVAGGGESRVPDDRDAVPVRVASKDGAAVPQGSDAAAQRVQRRVPVPLLRPEASRFDATTIALREGECVIVVPDAGGVGNSLIKSLERRGVTTLVIDDIPDDDDLARRLDGWKAQGPITGVYWLPALDRVDEAGLFDPETRAPIIERRVKLLYATMRALYDQPTFLISATRLGGRHGYDETGATDVVGGAVVGFTKAFAREKPESLVKAIDFAPSRKTTALADLLIEETLHDPGAVEIGYAEGHRWTVGLEPEAVEFGSGFPGADGVFVVTGAAGSIVSAIVADLARVSKGTFWLLDLTPEPDPQNQDLSRLDVDRDGLKRDLFERLKPTGERVTPAMVDQELIRIERSRAALAAIRSVEAQGGQVRYRSVDLRDADGVAEVMSEIVKESGRVDVLVHAAGLEISRPLPKKQPQEYDLVFDVKVDGWYNILRGLGAAPLGAAVVFSSIAGRFGNAGQTDYSAANDLLCKAIASFRRTRPETLGIALDWTAWAGIGMATRGSIPTIMRQAGIDTLSPEAGIPVVRRELSAETRGEVVIAEGLGVMLSEDRVVGVQTSGGGSEVVGPMVGRVQSFGVHRGLVIETSLDPDAQPFLRDHQIDGTPVLPGVMGIEAMCEAALVGFPELHVSALERIEFQMPFKFYRGEARTITVQVRYALDGDDVLAHCRLLGTRQLHGREELQETTHFTGTVRLTADPPSCEGARIIPDAPADAVGEAAIYDVYFHGPAYRVLGDAWRAGGVLAGRLAEGLPPNHDPHDVPTVVAPRLIELAFQTAGLAEIAKSERMGLPSKIERLEFLRATDGEPHGSTALVRDAGEGVFDIDVVDGSGQVLFSLHGYRTNPLPVPIGADPFKSLKE